MALSKIQNYTLKRTSKDFGSSLNRNTSDLRIKETDYSFHFELKLPGYIKEDFNFYINSNDHLVVTTEKRHKKEASINIDSRSNKHSYCYASAYFKRRFQLPKNVVRNEISVDYKDEILSFDLFKPSIKL
tara:strand:+ start:689 stop:1078 length:390 start_codon:yes stop_codon:yes gene_type:complete